MATSSHHVLPPDATIGDRLRRLRAERGLTQEQLAERAGLSVDMIKKLEQGQRQSARLTTLVALADALDVTLAELTDKRPRLDGGSDRLVLRIRDALQSPGVLPGIDLHYDDGAATPMPILKSAVDTAWSDYWRGNFVDLARRLPELIGEARISARADGPATAQILAQTYQITADLLVHLGRDDLAAVGAERAITAAQAGDDELQAATLTGTYAWVMLHQGRPAESASLAARMAEQIEPRMSSATPQHITVWGGLMVTAMASAAAADLVDDVDEYVSLARVGAARTQREQRAYQVSFGPTQLAAQVTHARMMLHQPDLALEAAAGVNRADLLTVEYGRHLVDVAQAQTLAARYSKAATALQHAKNLSPVWFRHQGPARSLVAELAERQPRMSPVVRDLVRALNPH